MIYTKQLQKELNDNQHDIRTDYAFGYYVRLEEDLKIIKKLELRIKELEGKEKILKVECLELRQTEYMAERILKSRTTNLIGG